MATLDETRKLLAYIAIRMGGVDGLAGKLQISPNVLMLYITGERFVPDRLVLRVVDLVLDEADAISGTSMNSGTEPNQRASQSRPDSKLDP